MCETAGVPASSLVSEGFIRQAAATSVGLGLPNMPVALVPSHPDALSIEELKRNTLEVTTEKVIENLTRAGNLDTLADEPGEREVVFRGSFEDVNDYFYDKE